MKRDTIVYERKYAGRSKHETEHFSVHIPIVFSIMSCRLQTHKKLRSCSQSYGAQRCHRCRTIAANIVKQLKNSKVDMAILMGLSSSKGISYDKFWVKSVIIVTISFLSSQPSHACLRISPQLCGRIITAGWWPKKSKDDGSTCCIPGDRCQSNGGDPVSSVVCNGESLSGSLKARFELVHTSPGIEKP